MKRGRRGPYTPKNGKALLRIMEDDAQRVPLTCANSANTMAHVDTIAALRALNRSVVNGERHCMPLPQGDHFDTALHTRALLCQHELSACKVTTGFGE